MNKFILDLVNLISEPMILLNSEYEIELINDNAKYILQEFGNGSLNTYIDVKAIVEKYNKEENEDLDLKLNISIRNINLIIYLKSFRFEGDLLYVLLFEESLFVSKKINELINSIGDMISIHDVDGKLLNYNNIMSDMLFENLGINIQDMIGESIHRLTEWGLAEDTITDKVLNDRKKVVKNVTYSNGKTITYTGMPIFKENGEIDNVVLTGRDVSSLIELKENLLKVQEKNIEYKRRLKEIESKEKNKDIIYSSKEMENIIKISKRVAKTDSQVFIRGSSGVGKEEIAKFIHKNSNRVDKKFIAVNCAAIPSELLEMEFFGYEEGSFTGAKKGGKKGLLEIANEGTLFLDEIGELPLAMQSKLLRAIQENGFMRVGGSQFIKADIRYISATNITLDDIFNGTKFRQDLYYRLSVVPINLPDIKNRKDDIIPLTSHFLNIFNKKHDRNLKVRKESMKLFLDYDWPGNVREIKNVMERMVILVDGEYIEKEDFYDAINLEFKKTSSLKGIDIHGEMSLTEAHDLLDKIMIEKSINDNGSILAAAKALNVAPSTIHRKLNK